MRELFPQWAQDATFVRINDTDKLAEVFASCPPEAIVSLDTETTGLDKLTVKILGFSFSWEEGVAYWVPLRTGDELRLLNEFVKGRTLVFYNSGYDIPILERHHVEIGNFEDAQILVFFENPNKRIRSLKTSSAEILGLDMVELKSLFGKSVSIKFDLLDPEVQTIYASMDADITLRLWKHLSYLKSDQKKIWGLESALVRPNVRMESNGITLDVPLLRKHSDTVGAKIQSLKDEIFRLAGVTFEVDSPSQVADVLYNRLGLPIKRRTEKRDAPKVDKDTLKMIEKTHPIVPLLMELGSLGTIKASFLDKLPGLVHPVTNRIHCSFIRLNVPTGRYSSSDPNLQNVPKQLDVTKGVSVRDAFIAADGFVLLDYDYSQIELRVAASLSKEPTWMTAYCGDIDVHSDTAKKIFHTQAPTKEQRSKAKTGNFGILYGQSGYSFAMKNPPMTKEEGDEFVRAWYEALPYITEWKQREIAMARRTGMAQTFFGRKRPMEGINATDRKLRAFWERSVVSHVCQGTAADIMKLAIIMLDRKIQQLGIADSMRILLTVHDELVFEVKETMVEEARKIIVEGMQIQLSGFVPLRVEGAYGQRWGSLKDFS